MPPESQFALTFRVLNANEIGKCSGGQNENSAEQWGEGGTWGWEPEGAGAGAGAAGLKRPLAK